MGFGPEFNNRSSFAESLERMMKFYEVYRGTEANGQGVMRYEPVGNYTSRQKAEKAILIASGVNTLGRCSVIGHEHVYGRYPDGYFYYIYEREVQ